MSQSYLYITSLAVVLIIYSLVTYNQDASLQGWLAPLNLVGGTLSTFLHTLLSGKGSLAAFALGFLLISALSLNTLVVYCASLFPGKRVSFKSPTSARLGGMLVRLMGVGLLTLLKTLFVLLVQGLRSMLTPRNRFLAQLQAT
jgi:hypothetical protein